MKDVTKPVADPFTGGTSFIRAMAKQLANIQPFESFSEWEWKWFREWLSKSQIEEGLTQAFEYGPNPSHSLAPRMLFVGWSCRRGRLSVRWGYVRAKHPDLPIIALTNH